MKAMIFAAGLGTRLRPLTDNLPKALVPVAGQPLLYHLLHKLQQSGYAEAVVNVHHFAGMIRDYVSSRDFGLQVRISDESGALLETGGGLRKAHPLLEPLDGPFLAHNVDIVSNLSLEWFRAQCRPDALASLLVSERLTQRYLLFRPEDLRLVGWTHTGTGEVRTPYPDLDPDACLRYAFGGIQQLSPEIFDALDTAGMPERFSIVDFYVQQCHRYPIYGVLAQGITLIDAGKPETIKSPEILRALNG